MKDFGQIINKIKIPKWLTGDVQKILSKVVVIIFVSYLAASVVSSVSMKVLSSMSFSGSKKMPGKEAPAKLVASLNDLNYRDVSKAVIDRNIFNSAGEVPDESEVSEDVGQKSAFDKNAPCRPPTLNVELVGIIYLGATGDSLATIKEKGYNIADIYKKEETIIGNDQASVYDIEQDQVVINNNGAKECLKLITKEPINTGAEDYGLADEAPPPADPNAGGGGERVDGGRVTLQTSYVEESLGPGFSKILETGRLVPANEDGKMLGFKLISVRGGSLWQKVGLSNGDILTSVNSVSMLQPDQGFAFYQSLQEEREIRLEYLKGGKTPSTVTIEIK
ncbi:MAG: type II secretion system protein N [Oligoflexales bacterium]